MPSPAQVLAQLQRSTDWEGLVPTLSGKGYRPWDEDPEPLGLSDMVYGLAHTYRYGAQSDPVISVAEHSVLVARIIRNLWPDSRLERAGLFHDASESVLHDLQASIRGRVSVTLPSGGGTIPWTESDLRVTRNIAKHYGVRAADLEAPEVRAADVLAASFEFRDCPSLWGVKNGLPPIPPEVAHLRIRGFHPPEAIQEFNLELELLGLSP